MTAEREMTLDEWVGRLHEHHAARRELVALRKRAEPMTDRAALRRRVANKLHVSRLPGQGGMTEVPSQLLVDVLAVLDAAPEPETPPTCATCRHFSSTEEIGPRSHNCAEGVRWTGSIRGIRFHCALHQPHPPEGGDR